MNEETVGAVFLAVIRRGNAKPILGLVATLCLAVAPMSTAGERAITVSLGRVSNGDSFKAADGAWVQPGMSYALRVYISALNSVSPQSGTLVIPDGSLPNDEGNCNRLDLVVWADPRYFSLLSDRHGTFQAADPAAAGSHLVRAYSGAETLSHCPRSTKNFELHSLKTAPPGEETVLVLLVFHRTRLLGELLIPLRVASTKPKGPGDVRIRSPLHSERSDDAVLTLIELYEKHVQAVFVSKEGLVTWRVVAERPLAYWPKYVDDIISRGGELRTAGANLHEILFPAGSYCEAGDCAEASRQLVSWIRHDSSASRPPSLFVQALPRGEDAGFVSVMLPIGVIPIATEPGHTIAETADVHTDVLFPEMPSGDLASAMTPDQDSVAPANFEAAVTATSNIASDVIEGRAWFSGLTIIESAQAVSERDHTSVSSRVPVNDPADPEVDTNAPAAVVHDPVQPNVKKYSASGRTAALANSGLSSDYAAYKVITYAPVPRKTLSASQTPCASSWSLFLPPDIDDPPLNAARSEMRELLSMWNSVGSRAGFQYVRGLSPLESLNATTQTENWLIVSHYDPDSGGLMMPGKDGNYYLGYGEIKQRIRPPGVIILLACQTGVPALNRFLATLLEKGGSTFISTSALLPGHVAGQFVTSFMSVLGEAGPAGIPIAEAFWQSLLRLPLDSQSAVPRFVLAGDPTVRLCAPPFTR